MNSADYQRTAQALVKRLDECCVGNDHDVVLGALVYLYAIGVRANPCCAATAANICARLAHEFSQLAAELQAGNVSPGPNHVH
jgi:hypothetical protein